MDAAVPIDPRLLEILVCPVTKGPLEYDRDKNELISRSANLAYPIRDGIPIMLPEEARQLDSDSRSNRDSLRSEPPGCSMLCSLVDHASTCRRNISA